MNGDSLGRKAEPDDGVRACVGEEGTDGVLVRILLRR